MTLTINGTEYTFKTSFNEYTVAEYVQAMACFSLPIVERVSKLTGIPVDALNGLSIQNFGVIAEAVAFTEQSEILAALSAAHECKDVAVESFDKMEKAKAIISASNLLNAITDVVKLYNGEAIAARPLLSEWNRCMFYIESLSKFFDKFKELSLHEPSEEEVEAGIDSLSGFRHYPIVFRIGRERGMSNDAVLEMSAIEVYTELLYDYRESEFKKRLQEVHRQKQEHLDKLK